MPRTRPRLLGGNIFLSCGASRARNGWGPETPQRTSCRGNRSPHQHGLCGETGRQYSVLGVNDGAGAVLSPY
jgi:hypothetical protein